MRASELGERAGGFEESGRNGDVCARSRPLSIPEEISVFMSSAVMVIAESKNDVAVSRASGITLLRR